MNLVTTTLANLHGYIPPLPTGRAHFYNSDTYRAKPVAPKKPAMEIRKAHDHMLDKRKNNECRVIAAIAKGIGLQARIARELELAASTVSLICRDLHEAGLIAVTRANGRREWEIV